MSHPFLLYHWSPSSRRESIRRQGLRIFKRSPDGSWRPPYLCWSKFPNAAWSLSATHGPKGAEWDLWCAWSDRVKSLRDGGSSLRTISKELKLSPKVVARVLREKG